MYSHTTLLFILPLKVCVVKPKSTYIPDDNDNDQIMAMLGQNEKLKASSPKIRLNIKLCITIAAPILSSIWIDHSTCKINGKLTNNTINPFQKNNRCSANITTYIKKVESKVNKKLAVEAALYKGIVRRLATLNTFCANSNK